MLEVAAQTKITDFDHTSLCDKQILRFDVKMHDSSGVDSFKTLWPWKHRKSTHRKLAGSSALKAVMAAVGKKAHWHTETV